MKMLRRHIRMLRMRRWEKRYLEQKEPRRQVRHLPGLRQQSPTRPSSPQREVRSSERGGGASFPFHHELAVSNQRRHNSDC